MKQTFINKLIDTLGGILDDLKDVGGYDVFANYIVTLEASIVELKRQRWISVDERLPNHTGPVDALKNHCGSTIRECDASCYEGRWSIHGRDGRMSCDSIFAWRERPELPEPPEKYPRIR